MTVGVIKSISTNGGNYMDGCGCTSIPSFVNSVSESFISKEQCRFCFKCELLSPHLGDHKSSSKT
ncbi:uncharacterized protein SPAPADRAFT_57723 [Spathaspora passalidarum NRRL Y-27907]|uniref:Uncharacterized protein n=1 Tax=Spathaspora passalidarum (strain NRRL Y-27907 / 11-Y1) TaxID=619300 RepID=G3AH00_SPAPN|nr:uncharacterized protein SPAPADRAFT_57723 [Spathaspora passalidarum NRRL Y-27907]EGW34673.1 hypothetical protein SPAPADRAFT_57723 [Spathaspora passalidarum NRRL Y-27907]